MLLRLLSCFALLASLAAAQVVGGNTKPQGNADDTPTFQSTTQLVVETITVKGKDGKPVTGLKASDFTVTEDGQPQTVSFLEVQTFEDTSTPLPEHTGVAIPFPKYTKGSISPEPPGDIRYRDRRLLALYFDLAGMQLPDQLRAYEAARKFVRTQMTPSDLVAIMAFMDGSVQVMQDFTGDRDRLLSVIETLVVGEDENAISTNDASSSDTGASFGQNDGEFNIFFTDRQLAALQTAATMLGRLNEKKALVYFASGLRLNGTNNQAQLNATLNAAIRAGVAFWPVDARGLVATAPLGDASRASPGGQGMYSGAAANAMLANFQRSQDTLWTLAADTGGKALLDYNDLSQGIVQAQRAVSTYYILGYYSSNATPDGKFRRIKIALNPPNQGDLDYRQGYFSNKVFSKFTSADKERQLEDALMLGDPITDLTIAMELDYFQLNRAEYFVPLAVKIPGSELALARRGGNERTVIDFIGEIKDEYGVTISNVRDKVDIKLNDTTAAELAKRPIEYDTGFTLLPGKYKVKFLARDAETGRIGTYETAFVIPNLNREEKRIPLSSVVLSSQRVPLSSAIFNVGNSKNQTAINASPLVQDGQKLIPSVTRVFSKSKDMYVYFQAYQQNVETAAPLLSFVTFYRGSQKVFETPPVRATDALNNRLHTLPVKFQFPLEKLATGEYTAQVSVIEPSGRKTAFWQTQILVVP
jgi:VWFA-related protein